MSEDYKEMYLKEKMMRLAFEGDLLVAKHEKLMMLHEETKKELKNHQAEKEEAAKKNTSAKKKTSRKRKK